MSTAGGKQTGTVGGRQTGTVGGRQTGTVGGRQTCTVGSRQGPWEAGRYRGRQTKNCGSLFVYARGSKRPNTGKCVSLDSQRWWSYLANPLPTISTLH